MSELARSVLPEPSRDDVGQAVRRGAGRQAQRHWRTAPPGADTDKPVPAEPPERQAVPEHVPGPVHAARGIHGFGSGVSN
jgi:hypothetical protein